MFGIFTKYRFLGGYKLVHVARLTKLRHKTVRRCFSWVLIWLPHLQNQRLWVPSLQGFTYFVRLLPTKYSKLYSIISPYLSTDTICISLCPILHVPGCQYGLFEHKVKISAPKIATAHYFLLFSTHCHPDIFF